MGARVLSEQLCGPWYQLELTHNRGTQRGTGQELQCGKLPLGVISLFLHEDGETLEQGPGITSGGYSKLH